MLYIFSVAQPTQRIDYELITKLLYSVFSKDSAKFDYTKVYGHFDNIRKRLKHFIKLSKYNTCDSVVGELFKVFVFYNKRYYFKAKREFERKYPEYNLEFPVIPEHTYSSIAYTVITNIGKSIEF